jgi:hypothetical protein
MGQSMGARWRRSRPRGAGRPAEDAIEARLEKLKGLLDKA